MVGARNDRLLFSLFLMLIIISVLLFCYIALFISSIFSKDNSYVDVFWGIAFIIIAVLGLYLSEKNISQIVITVLILLWGIRLSLHIFSKKQQHRGEDKRYAAWRSSWKYFYTRSFFQVYILQMFLACIVATPIFLIHFHFPTDNTNTFLLVLGSIISLFGLVYESQADSELKNFMKIKRPGELLTSGLRKYHRYPQYFGEAVFWFGISTIGLQVSFYSFVGFITIYILLNYVSGIPMLEKRYEGNTDYKKYSEKVRKFFPRF